MHACISQYCHVIVALSLYFSRYSYDYTSITGKMKQADVVETKHTEVEAAAWKKQVTTIKER